MQVNEYDKFVDNNYRYALTFAVNVSTGDPLESVFDGFRDKILKWVNCRGSAAADIFITVISPDNRNDEIRDYICGVLKSSTEIENAMRQMEDATLLFGSSDGLELERYSLSPRLVFKTALVVRLPDDRLVRLRVRHIDRKYRDPMWTEIWNGKKWLTSPADFISPAECLLFTPVTDEFLSMNSIQK